MFYDIYADLCKKKGITVSRAAIEMGISKGTVSVWKNKGTSPQMAQLEKIANYFDVPMGYLLGEENTIPPETQKAPTLNKKDERDIARRLEETLNLLESSDALMFDGEPLDQESMDLLKTSLQNQYTLAKKIAKQKFTPKKYRTDNEK